MNRNSQQGDSMKTLLRLLRRVCAAVAFAVLPAPLPAGELADKLRAWDTMVVPADSPQAKRLSRMLDDDARARIRAANLRESRAWQEIKTRADWEKYRD